MSPSIPLSRWASIAAAIVMLAGCASTEKRFEKASELEANARWVEAADQYIDVLKRDASYPGAADRLADVGAKAISQLMDLARSYDQAGSPAEGVVSLDKIQSLVNDARQVGVSLSMPTGLFTMRARLIQRSIEILQDRARAAVGRKDYREAIAAYDEILSKYSPDATTRMEVVMARADAYVTWGRAEMAARRFRSAYDKIGMAVASLDSTNSQQEQDARMLYAAALAEGVRKLAVLPFWQTDVFRDAAPTRLRDDLNQSLADDRTTTPSPFVALVDPANSRRYLRLNRIDTILLDRIRMADIGRQIGADFVATGEAVRFTRTERVRKEETVRARIRGRAGSDTTYVRRELETRFYAKVEYRVVDASTGQVRAERSIEADVTDRFTRSTFGGDYRSLDLSDRERREFDPAEYIRQDDALGLQLADRLSARLAQRIYADVLSQIN